MAKKRPSTVVHCGFNNDPETKLVQRYAAEYRCEYRWQGIKNDLFKAADVIKYAKFAAIWNGRQHYAPLITRLCKLRGIPRCYIEQGILPQKETFFIDPSGFCSDSVLAKDLSWVNEYDIKKLNNKRDELRAKYTIDPQGYIFVPLQVHNDTQVLHY